MKQKLPCKLVIAGPGAGKTYDLIEAILDVLPKLKSHKFLAVITYTNAATAEIKSRLILKTKIPPNVFIGTIHSFLNKFILLNYLSNLDPTIAKEKRFVEIDTSKLPDIKKLKRGQEAIKHQIINNIIKSGTIPFSEIDSLCNKLLKIESKKILNILKNRLQFVFVDEYQDATIAQHNIFESIFKQKQTEFYFVGDPEQSIYSFNKKRKTEFKSIPILRLRSKPQKYTIVEKVTNRRSTPNIVSFINKLNAELQQVPLQELPKGYEVMFIQSSHTEEIIKQFQSLCEADDELRKESKFILTYKNKLIPQEILDKYSVNKLNEKTNISNSPIKLCLEYLEALTGYSPKQYRLQKNISELQLRKIVVNIIHQIQKINLLEEDKFRGSIKEYIIADPSSTMDRSEEIKSKYNSLYKVLNQSTELTTYHHSTIHKSKGLEATSVLVIAENLKELQSWLVQSKQERHADNTDKCRLGFVAFSRARKFLCIACLQSNTKFTLFDDSIVNMDEFDIKTV